MVAPLSLHRRAGRMRRILLANIFDLGRNVHDLRIPDLSAKSFRSKERKHAFRKSPPVTERTRQKYCSEPGASSRVWEGPHSPHETISAAPFAEKAVCADQDLGAATSHDKTGQTSVLTGSGSAAFSDQDKNRPQPEASRVAPGSDGKGARGLVFSSLIHHFLVCWGQRNDSQRQFAVEKISFSYCVKRPKSEHSLS
jgi:hypothetical protein